MPATRLRATTVIPIILACAGASLIAVAIALGAWMVVTVMLLAVLWLVLVRHYEIALAILLVGFYLYPTVLGLIGAEPSPIKTLLFYTLLGSASLLGGFLRYPADLRSVMSRRATLAGLALAAWTVINSVMLSLDSDVALKRLGYLALLSVAPMIAGQFITRRELHRFYWISVWIILLGSILAISNLLQGDIDAMIRVSVDDNVLHLWGARILQGWSF